MTRATEEHPTKRMLVGYKGEEYVVELRRTLILVRPKGSRSGGKAEVAITPSALHLRLMTARVEEERRERRRKRRR
jgi:hypothetical protein